MVYVYHDGVYYPARTVRLWDGRLRQIIDARSWVEHRRGGGRRGS